MSTNSQACSLISSISSKFLRQDKFLKNIKAKKLETIPLAMLNFEQQIFAQDLKEELAELQTIYQKMENGLIARKEIMEEAELEENYQKSKLK